MLWRSEDMVTFSTGDLLLCPTKFDGKDFDRSEDISELYGIHSLPTKILIDKEGMIIGRYGGGGESHEKMDEKLKEVFGN